MKFVHYFQLALGASAASAMYVSTMYPTHAVLCATIAGVCTTFVTWFGVVSPSAMAARVPAIVGPMVKPEAQEVKP